MRQIPHSRQKHPIYVNRTITKHWYIYNSWLTRTRPDPTAPDCFEDNGGRHLQPRTVFGWCQRQDPLMVFQYSENRNSRESTCNSRLDTKHIRHCRWMSPDPNDQMFIGVTQISSIQVSEDSTCKSANLKRRTSLNYVLVQIHIAVLLWTIVKALAPHFVWCDMTSLHLILDSNFHAEAPKSCNFLCGQW